ncbi:hypothetical protein GGI07_000406 [Coemansia sp. Benny D115]|nr:hypothetical protein GGI07_000406 [Coemansia sp. Benny D115]
MDLFSRFYGLGAIPRQRWLNPDDKYDFASEAEKDRIYVMDEADEYSEIKALEMTSEGELQPYSQDLRVHGFDIYWDPQDQDDMTFMIVNHQLEHAAISIFSHRRGSDYMTHVETVRSSLLQSPNDVVAVSKREFYATNDMKYYKGPLREISLYLRLANGHLVHRNEDGVFSIAANSIAYPNGIAMNGDLIYVASCTDPSIQVYRRHKNGSLDYQGRTFYWDTIPDNLHVDPSTRQIYSTTFTKHAETHKYFKSPSLNTTTTAGTKLLRFTPRSGSVHEFDVENLLIDSGTLVPTATIAVVQRRNSIERLLMGCVMCNFIVACDDVI